MSGSERKPPARWRAARFPEAGGRWDTPVNRFVWNRDKGRDVELWRGRKHLATVKPDGAWFVHVGARDKGWCATVAEAKAAAKLAATKGETP